MNSIRMRLLAGICLSLSIVFAFSGFMLNAYLRGVLESSFDDALLERANVFAKTTEQRGDGTLEFEFLEANLYEYWPHNQADYYQVWKNTGETAGRSPSLGKNDLPVILPLTNSPLFENIVLPDGRSGKMVVLNFAPLTAAGQPARQYVMAIATSRKELDRAQFRVVKGLLAAGFALILGAFPAVWWSVRRALFSLQSLSEQTNAIKADNLSYRFPMEDAPRELLPICIRLNSLLERLESAFNRERRFTADAAHELRTPIAELRTLSEVGIEEAHVNAPAMREYFEDALGIASHLEKLVTTLLALTRCEAGLEKANLKDTNLPDVIREVWSPYEPQATGKRITTTLNVTAGILIQSDGDLLRALLANIFSNAISYTPAGGEIRLALHQAAGTASFCVGNSIEDLKEQDLAHIFEPFWRKAAGRTDSEHCGVGLSLVAAYAQVLGMTVNASISPQGLFQIKLHFPIIR